MTALANRQSPLPAQAQPDPERAARDRCRAAIAQMSPWPGALPDVLPARRWFMVEQDGAPNADGDVYIERVKIVRALSLLVATRSELIDKHGACDQRLDTAIAEYVPVKLAFDDLSKVCRSKGRY